MKKKSAKRSLLVSVLAMLLCCAMLVGTTFAWFTDSVTTGRNTIKSGNLDVVLEYKTNWEDQWAIVDENTKLFNEDALYEPGYVEVVFLRVSNAGSLALKYNLSVELLGETGSTNVNGEEFKLSDYLQIGAYVQDEYSGGANYADLLMPVMFGDRTTALSNITDLTAISDATGIIRDDAPVLPGEETAQVAALVLTMPETVGNEANHKTGVAAPTVDLGITLVATQLTHESDSFDNQYDKDAAYPEVINYDHKVSDLAGLKEAFAEGGNVILEDDVTMDNMLKLENGAEVYLNLNGKTINFEPDAAFKPGNPMFYPLAGTKLVIDGNGTIDLGDSFAAALVYPAGEVIIENGTFIRDRVPAGTDPDDVQTLFMGVKSVGASVVINGGYFDGGYYDANAEMEFSETDADIANRGKAADKNLYRMAIKNNTSLLLNLSWSSAAGTQDFRIYGGTFVGANPAWGDEGCAMPITPDYLRPWSYYQGMFLEGQQMYDDRIEIPAGYTITESKTDDGRPVFTVEYSE